MGSLRALLGVTWRRPSARIGWLLLGAVLAAALVLPPILPDPAAQPDILSQANLPPGLGHPFGTDMLSRDVLSRVAWGARVSLSVAALAVVLSVTIGAAVGLVAGYAGGRTDAVLMRLVDAALAVPRLFILLLLLAVWERIPLAALIVILGTTGWFATSRLVRGEVLRLRGEDFVRGAEALGAGRRRVMFRHLLPNTLGPLLVAATLGVGEVILLEAGLSFLGLGIQPPTPSWGGMILDAKPVLVTAPWSSVFPGLAILVTVLAVNLVGDALSDALDPRSA
ncbi:MAG TPA: ABC transporter permease [Gemmatimonadales bacterium]|jgi:peptide/nickel transport system permease protein|nr:ABC transporter permease [Gemmatimonadales bacterium]